MTTKTTKPTYEELQDALINLDSAWLELFGQVASNPVTNAWGKPINFAKINGYREKASSIVYRAKEAQKSESTPASPTLQAYLADENNLYGFRDQVLDYFVQQEQRRQSKNCPEVQPWQEIANEVEEELSCSTDQMRFVDALFHALSKVARGETR